MKNLLVLALLGLLLGAGAWKVQNPDGTVDDFRNQAMDLSARLQSGVQAVRFSGQNGVTSRQQALEDRLNQLELSLGNNQPAELSGPINELADLARDTAEGSAANVVRLDAIDSRLELLVRRLDEQTVEQSLQTVQQTLDNLDEEMGSLRESVNAGEAALGSELTAMREKVSALELRIDTLTAARSTDSQAPTEQMTPGETANTASLAASLDERFKELEARLATVNTDSRRIATLTDQLQAAREEIAQLRDSTASNSRSVSRLDDTVSELRTAGESLSIDAIQAQIRDQLAQVQSQVESDNAADNTEDLQTLLNNTRTRIQELEKRVQDLPASSTEATNAQQIQSALESQIVALDKRLQDAGSTNPELADTLSNVQQKVDQLVSRDFVTREDLRAQAEPRAVQYKIYFNRNSVDITEAAAEVLDSFIAQEQNRTTGVSIFGFTDRLGSAAYNQQLALQRATNVRSYLIQNGFDYTKIKALNGLGEDAAAAILPDNAGDAQQRVVVIYASQP